MTALQSIAGHWLKAGRHRQRGLGSLVYAILIALVAWVAMAVGAAAEALAPADYFRLKERADSLYLAGDFAAAAPLYAPLTQAHPGNGEQLLRYARCLVETGDQAKAFGLVVRALEMGFGPEAPTAYRLAQAMALSGQDEGALAWLERALGADFEDQAAIKSDPAFAGLAESPRFQSLAGIAQPATTRQARWNADLDFFLAEVRRLHAAPGSTSGSSSFAAAVDQLKEAVPTLSDVGIAFEIQRLLAMLGDGHSVLALPPGGSVRLRTLPLEFYQFSDGIFVTDAADHLRPLVGARLDSLAGQPPMNLLAALAPYISRDNDQGLRWIGPKALTLADLLVHLGRADDAGEIALTVADQEGGRRSLSIAPGESRWRRSLGAPPGPAEAVPLWLRDPEKHYWFEALPALDAFYVQVNRVRDAPEESLADFTGRLKSELSRQERRHLIIDLRHNGGGNNGLNLPLVRLAIVHEEASSENRVFVITGRNTFSAAQNLVNQLERMTEAVFVGEETSSKPNFTGETTSVELPHSGLRFSVSSLYWQDSSPLDRRPYIPVDLPVALSSGDYFGNVDPVMAVLSEILRPR
ncbi:tetratricopeptide repeat protein [Pelagibius sp.]|uniref:tetratricopeptide repeat protein n=1 Tax=Pelagibius sp. TaxID=1931238 RepID=UPI003BAE7360